MKAILMSDHAKWCALMMNGDKTVEVRKGTALYKATQKLIDEYGFAEFYVYCTKDSKQLVYYQDVPNEDFSKRESFFEVKELKTKSMFNGKVIFKFRCYKVQEIETSHDRFDEEIWYSTGSMQESDILEHSCLNSDELDNYLYGEKGTAIHISDLEIFDKPKELSEFNALQRAKATDCGYLKQCKNCGRRFNRCHLLKPLKKAPQSFTYIEV